jgi:uncharacterized protein
MRPPTLAELERAVGIAVAQHPEIAAAWIFGSAARGDSGQDSDLDLAVLLKSSTAAASQAWLRELAGALERYSGSGRVDILVLGEQGPVLRHRVLSEGRLVHDADPDARVAFEGRTIAEYLDWKPTHDIAMRTVFAGLRDRFARGPS